MKRTDLLGLRLVPEHHNQEALGLPLVDSCPGLPELPKASVVPIEAPQHQEVLEGRVTVVAWVQVHQGQQEVVLRLA
jgi:hypothetical protein